MTERIDTRALNSIVVGRVEPHIYAFTTGTIPNYLKVGDTYRPVKVRIEEWKKYFSNLCHIYTESALVNDHTIFRDHSVHNFLINEKHRARLQPTDIDSSIYYSNEFFKDATTDDINDAIADIKECATTNGNKYQLYSTEMLPITHTYTRGESFTPRKNQEIVINNFKKVYKKRKNLLMYAVMRFGKSFTSLCCAKEMGADFVLVVSAKADVKEEWKKTVESIGNFEGYYFYDKTALDSDISLKNEVKQGKKVVLFLTLQDLQGEKIKERHKEVFCIKWDLLLVDETHFGARAEQYGKILLSEKDSKGNRRELKAQLKDTITLDEVDAATKELKRDVTIHLSGTPYRILMGSEFEKEDIIAFVQYTDIADAQDEWIENNNKLREENQKEDWENPYFGFPQMLRFAFNPNESSLKKIEELKQAGAASSFSEIFRPKSTDDIKENGFIYEDIVLDFLRVIDGTKEDSNVFAFLDNELIKKRQVMPTYSVCSSLHCVL
ncbi:MAG: DEAD/DEAH box helicase family protein [Muribaculaceae bacterium]